MKPHTCRKNCCESIDLIGDCHLSPGRTTKILPHFHQRNYAARRFDCPAFFVPQKPVRQIASYETWTVTHSTGGSETTLHCAIVRPLHSRRAPFRFDFRNAHSVRTASKEDDVGSTATAGVILVGCPLFLTIVLSPGTKCCMG